MDNLGHEEREADAQGLRGASNLLLFGLSAAFVVFVLITAMVVKFIL